jgi:type IV fimbrial biogenesis protein FimT
MDVSFKNTLKIHQKLQISSLKSSLGLTLIELLVALVVISVVLSYGIPEARSIVKLNESAVTINKLVSDFAYSRNESIKRMRDVVICKSSNGQTCNNNSGWQNGWIIFVDQVNRNKQRSFDEPLLKVQQPLGNHLNITFHSFNRKKMIVYEPSGAADYSNGTFRFCTNNEKYHKDLVLSRTGRTYLKVNPGLIYDPNKSC